MENTLVKLRVINGEVKMRRDEVNSFMKQSVLLYNNLSKLNGREAVEKKYPEVKHSINFYSKWIV